MDNTLKILEIFSRNWIYIFSLLLLVPCLKLAINSYVQVKVAKLQIKNSVIIQVENKDFKKSLEISTNDLNLADIKNHIKEIENPNLMLIDKKIDLAFETETSTFNKVS